MKKLLIKSMESEKVCPGSKRIQAVGLALATILVLAGVQAHAANIVLNPGFESGAAKWMLSPAASGSDFGIGTWGGAHTGSQSAYFGGFTIGSYDTISQTLTTVAGDAYSFSFWLKIGALSGSANGERVFWNGTMILDLTNASNQAYTQYTFTEVAADTSTAIAFAGYNPQYWNNIDDVAMTDLGPTVPEPTSLLLLGTGLGALGLATWRRRK